MYCAKRTDNQSNLACTQLYGSVIVKPKPMYNLLRSFICDYTKKGYRSFIKSSIKSYCRDEHSYYLLSR